MTDRVAWESWRVARLERATQPYGIASLARTEWLDSAAREVDGLPGLWRLRGQDIVGEGTGDLAEIVLAPGQDVTVDSVKVRNFARGGTNALRIFDPSSPNRTTITGIDSYDYDPDWRVEGRYRRSEGERTADVDAVDGFVSKSRVAGEVDLITPAGAVTLTVIGSDHGGYSAVIGDATNGDETYRFRFLDLGDGPDEDRFVVDFNRTYLPPCAFSAEYVCPLPLPGNRWTIPVRAGERTVARN